MLSFIVQGLRRSLLLRVQGLMGASVTLSPLNPKVSNPQLYPPNPILDWGSTGSGCPLGGGSPVLAFKHDRAARSG